MVQRNSGLGGVIEVECQLILPWECGSCAVMPALRVRFSRAGA
jgi:hypothetical protein